MCELLYAVAFVVVVLIWWWGVTTIGKGGGKDG